MNSKTRVWIILSAAQLMLWQSSAFATVNDPVVTPVGGASTSPQTVSVTVTDGTNGATIYFTTDGSNPTTASESVPSGGTILIAKNSTLNVQAFQSGSTSNLVSVNYGVNASVSAGSLHSLILKNDGSVWASGDNSAGELGNGTTTPSSTPVQVLAPSGQSGFLSNIISVAADGNDSFAVDNQGNVWAWGSNGNGQLGVGNTTNESLPTQVPGITGAVAVVTSQSHALVLTNTGTVYGWGANTSGQVGNGAMTAWETKPVQVMASASQPLSGIVALSAGANHTAAIDDNGNVWTWGANTTGQLGNGDTSGTAQAYPVQLSGVSGVVTVAAGATNSYALESNGNVYAWGDNSIGELGNGTMSTTFSATPARISGLGAMVNLGNQLAVDSSDNVWAWGDNTSGRLGLGAQGNDATSPLELSLYSGTAASLADTTGNNQSVHWNQFSPLTVTVSNGGNPVANTLVDFTLTSGSGELSLTSGGSQFSGIVQVLTNSLGQATIYFQEGSSGSGSSLVTAESEDGQSQFTLINGGIGVPNLPMWGYGVVTILAFVGMSRFLMKKQPRLTA